MLNSLRFRERAAHDDGTDCSGEEASRVYASEVYASESVPIFQRRGGKQVRIGRPEPMPIGPPEKHWHLAFIAEYPSVGASASMLPDPDDRKPVRHRQAAVEESRLIRMKPAEPGASFGEIRH